jgi:T5SS/PEP-CTERM-associated repeat protein
MSVGHSGPGALNITGGARVQCAAAYTGIFGSILGTIAVGGGSELIAQDRCIIGLKGASTITVFGASLVQCSSAQIGVLGPGTASIFGAGSRWICSSEMVVGAGNHGNLSITGGGEVRSADGILAISGIGTVGVSGAGSTWTITDVLSVGGNIEAGQNGGTGLLFIGAGGAVTAGAVSIFPQGSVELSGGTLDATSIGYAFGPGGTFNLLSGVLHAVDIEFSIQNQGATLAPGRPAGFTLIAGSYTQLAAAAMEIEIGGTEPHSQFDQVVVQGAASLGGRLVLRLIDGFVPSPTQTFEVLLSAGITGAFANVANGGRLAIAGGGGSFIVNYGPGSAFNPTKIVLSGFGPCASDFNGDGVANSTDVSDFINAWFSDLANGTLVTDFDHNGVVNSTDVSAFINQWFADQASGCGG